MAKRHPHPAHAVLVEASFFVPGAGEEERPFDKLGASGVVKVVLKSNRAGW